VDESFITLHENGEARARRGNIGPPVDPSVTTKVVEFNDLAALENALSAQDVACVLAEPALTNVGIVHPEPGFHDALRAITRRTGTLLIIDETHTICAGPGGYTRAENLAPDFIVFGKPIGGGVPGAAYGFTEQIAQLFLERQSLEDCDTGGIGGTLAGNALSLAAMKATLSSVLTKEAFDRMIPLAERWSSGVQKAISEFEIPWHVTRLGCRAEYLFSSRVPKNGTEAHNAMDFELERFMHLYAMNRGILLTPFHNMALMSPQTENEDVDKHTRVFREAVRELLETN
jgi:glutamate-1-semialdehyde 2,1-aminomutase